MVAILNIDVLLRVLALPDSLATTTSLMATCKTLNHECAKIVLTGWVTFTNFWSPRKWTSFLLFLRAEDGNRLPDDQPRHPCHLFVGRRCRLPLDTLSCPPRENCGPYFSEDHYIPRLRKPHARPAGGAPVEGCQRRLSDPQPPQDHFFCPAKTLQDLAERVESLQLTCRVTHRVEFMEPTIAVIYPKLRHLKVQPDTDLLLALAPYVHAFPNLTHLCVTSFGNSGARCYIAGPGPPASGVGRDRWRHLMEFVGAIEDLYHLTELTSHVPRLAFRWQSDHDISLLGAVLARAQPVHLIFGPGHLHFILFVYYVKSLAEAGIREGTTALKYLELNVYLEMGKFVFENLMDDLKVWLLTMPRLQAFKMSLVLPYPSFSGFVECLVCEHPSLKHVTMALPLGMDRKARRIAADEGRVTYQETH